MIKIRWATQCFAFLGRPNPTGPPPRSWGDPPALRPSGARGPGPRVWPTGQCKCPPTVRSLLPRVSLAKIFHFQFETGIPRVAFIFLGPDPALPGARWKILVSLARAFLGYQMYENINVFSTLRIWPAQNRQVLCS